MEKDKLPPIPTPATQRWREFRIQFLPALVFAVVLCGIVFLWRSYVQPVGVIGYAETNVVNVTSLQDGMISELLVERFQYVTAGQPIAEVVNSDPELIKAQMAVAQTELDVLRSRMELDQRRNNQGYQQLRVDFMGQQVDRAVAEANLVNASSNYFRVVELVKSNVLSQADFDLAKSKRDALQAEVQERTRLMADLQSALATMTNLVGEAAQDTITAAIDAKARELSLMLKPSILKAPISGMISLVQHVKGERILRGMPVVSITDPVTRRIIGYIRQPVTDVPTINDSVRITSSSQPKVTGTGKIVHIGAGLESINPALLSVDTKRMEVGLPIVVTVPEGFRLLPGEYVNLTIERTGKK